jgi:hypothetical protein
VGEVERLEHLRALKRSRDHVFEVWMAMELFCEQRADEGDPLAAGLVLELKKARNEMRAENVGASSFLAAEASGG